MAWSDMRPLHAVYVPVYACTDMTWSDMRSLHVPAGAEGSKYDLIANMVHDGKLPTEGSYLAHIHRKVEDIW